MFLIEIGVQFMCMGDICIWMAIVPPIIFHAATLEVKLTFQLGRAVCLRRVHYTVE